MGFRSALFFMGIGASLPGLPASSVTTVYVQVLIARPNGQVLAELRTQISSVSWKYRGIGETTFPVARTDVNFDPELLRFGNRVLLQFSNGLPSWGGIIASPRPWDIASAEVTVLQAKWALSNRKSAWSRVFSAATAGNVFRLMLEEANARSPLGIHIGDSPIGGAGYDMEFNSEFLGDVFDDLVAYLDVDDWDVVAELVGGVIQFTANLYQPRGRERLNVALSNGRRGNVGDVRYKDMAGIVNAWSLAGKGQGWGKNDRAYAYVTDETSIGLYGYNEDSLVVETATSSVTLEQIGRKLLETTAYPHALVALDAADRSPGAFEDYGLGDTVTVDLWNYGFGGYRQGMRVLGREFFPEDGSCDLVLEGVQ